MISKFWGIFLDFNLIFEVFFGFNFLNKITKWGILIAQDLQSCRGAMCTRG